jgi:hypothetical protein
MRQYAIIGLAKANVKALTTSTAPAMKLLSEKVVCIVMLMATSLIVKYSFTSIVLGSKFFIR